MTPTLLPPSTSRRLERVTLRGRITTWRTPALPQNSVRASFQDHRNYLWFATEEGAVRFDGAEWKRYRIADGLVSNFVQAISEDRLGRIWIGTRVGGLSRFDRLHARQAWHAFTPADGLPDVDVRAITRDGDGVLWIGTRRGVVRLDPESSTFTPFTGAAAAAEDVTAVAITKDGMIWSGSRKHGIASFDPRTGSWRACELPSTHVTSLAADPAGQLWVGTRDGVFQVSAEGVCMARFGVEEGLPDQAVLSLSCDRAGDLWIGTEHGGVSCLRRSDGESQVIASLPASATLTHFMTMSLLEDRNGVYWFGSLAGLTCFEPEGTYRAQNWTTLTRRDGLAHDLITAVAQDSTRRYWFGSYGGGATSLVEEGETRRWESFSVADGLSSDIVKAIGEDALGRLWFGTVEGGLSRFDPQSRQWKTMTTRDGLAANVIRTIRRAPDGLLWVGTDGGGISVVDPSTEPPAFRNYGMAAGLPSNRVGAILHDRSGRVWAATYEGGIGILDQGVWSSISKDDGLPANDVYCLAEDPAGRIWAGTGGSGLACLERGRWRVFTERDGLPNDTIYQILVESERSIWASTNRGVFRLRFEEAGDVIVSFDHTDGLGDDECNGGASLVDHRGRFWIGTLSGVSCIDPRDVPERIPPCHVFINGFFVHDEPVDLEETEPIEDSRHEFSIEYGAVEYVSPQKVRYRTWLEGFDRQWSRVTSERKIRYTNLAPGHYRFRVQARNWGGEWSEAVELPFQVVPDRERAAREEAIERERIEKRVLETAHETLQKLTAELREANERLRAKEVELELQAREDALTRVLNRRYLDILLQQEFDRAVRFRRPLTIVMADLDHFKSVNDRFGHAVGDEVLRIAARLMRTSVRSVDIVARYGGEEFALLLPETSGESARAVCEKIRRAIEEYPWHDLEGELRVTASLGCSDDLSSASPSQMLHEADQKLFEAKRKGRNRVCG